MNAAAITTTPQELIDALAAAWTDAKNGEKAANARRLEIEKEMVSILGSKVEGAETHEGMSLAITITGTLNRKVDDEKLAEVFPLIPEAIRARLFKVEPKLVMSELRYIENNEPAVYKLVAAAITTTPAKPAVAIKSL